MLTLKRPDLLVQAARIGDRWLETSPLGHVEILDPATLRAVARVPRCGAAETAAAIDAAEAVKPTLRRMPGRERAALVTRLASAIREHREDLAQILTAEQGKPLVEARAELDYGLLYFDYYADFGRHLDGEWLASDAPDQRLWVQREPLGIGAAITPWNFPMAMVARKFAPALVAGNAVVLKPAEKTPLVALAIARLAEESGLPAGTLSVLTGSREDASTIGGTLVDDARVRKLSFTGSTSVGKALYAACAGTMKRLSLELGGNAPFLVFDDADLDQAVAGLMASKFRNAGQACVAANRVLVQRSVHDAFVERIEARIRALRVGPGTESGVDLGPLVDERAAEKVERHVDDARARGGDVLVGGQRHALGGSFFEPTLILGVTPDAAMSCEETFGPVAGIIPFDREDEAIAIANSTPFGLASYAFTRDVGRVHRVADALESGMVAINSGTLSSAAAPFGGIKDSGLGREGGRQGLEEWQALKYVRLGGIAS